MTAIASFVNISKHYVRGKEIVPVLTNLNLQIEEGDFLAIMGPSGSGKTTLLNMAGGLDSPTEGALTVAGSRLDQLSGSQLSGWRARNVGFVFQFYNLLPALNAQGNVELPLLLVPMSASDRRQRIAAALALVSMSDRAKHKPSELSGGQQQRVAIARAIVSDPRILICDEPTGDLDRKTADEILGLLQLLNREQKKTIVMVTHDPQAAAYATHQLHVDKGQLVQMISTGEPA